jgi:hypothetical protein
VERTAVFILFTVVLFALPLFGCETSSSPTPSLSPSPTVTLPPGQEPAEVVSVTGPWPSGYEDGKPVYNPGGPVVELTLKNIYDEPIIFLEATLEAESVSGHPFLFSFFGIYPSHPLRPGEIISTKSVFISGGFGNNIPYPLTIKGTLESNIAFSYIEAVFITQPPE